MKNQEQKTGGNHTSNITHHTSQKGITLIALIITIIVMLILVGVTINVAMNGGLMEKADRAKTQQETAIEREQLQELILGKMDDKLKIPTDLGKVKIKDTTYNVTARDEAGAIKIDLTEEGTQRATYTRDLVTDLKLKGVTIENSANYLADLKSNIYVRVDSYDSSLVAFVYDNDEGILYCAMDPSPIITEGEVISCSFTEFQAVEVRATSKDDADFVAYIERQSLPQGSIICNIVGEVNNEGWFFCFYDNYNFMYNDGVFNLSNSQVIMEAFTVAQTQNT